MKSMFCERQSNRHFLDQLPSTNEHEASEKDAFD
jgi:hypothetical protein